MLADVERNNVLPHASLNHAQLSPTRHSCETIALARTAQLTHDEVASLPFVGAIVAAMPLSELHWL